MSALPYPKLYGDPPECREEGCSLRPIWTAETVDNYPGLVDEYVDYLCGRHLGTFLADWVTRDGSRVVLTRMVR